MTRELGTLRYVFDIETTALDRAQDEVRKLGSESTSTADKTRAASKHMEKSYKDVSTAATLALRAATALGAGLSVQQVIKYADGWKQVNNQLRQVTTSESNLAAVRNQLLGISKSTNAELGNTVNLYSELFRATRDLGTSQQTVAGVTKTINNLFKAGGKSAAETAGAVRQLAQGLASGALRGDEFNSVAEGAPRIMDAMAKHLKMTRGELREFAATGGISAEIMIAALEGYSEEAQRMADITEETFGQKMVNAKTNVTEFVGGMESATGAIGLLGDGIEGLSEHLDTAASVATAVALVMAGRVASSAYAAGASFAYATTQSMAYQAALARMAGVSATAAAAQTGLASALALVGGPVGALVVVTGGLALMMSRMESATETVARLREEMDGLNRDELTHGIRVQQSVVRGLEFSIEKMKRQSAGNTAAKEKLAELNLELERARNELQELERGMKGVEDREFNAMLDEYFPPLITFIDKTGRAAAAVGELTDEQAKAKKAVDDQIAGIALQRSQLAMTAREAAIFKEVWEAYNNGASPESIRLIAAQAGALYDQTAALETAAAEAKAWNDMIAQGAADAAKSAAEVARAQKEAAEKSDEEWMRFRDSFSDSVRDIGLRNGDVVETIEDAWKGLGWKIMGDLAASGFLSMMTGKGGGFDLASTLAGAGTSGKMTGALLAKIAPSLMGGSQGLTPEAYVAMMEGKMSPTGGGANPKLTDLKNIGLSIGAGIAGSWAGTELGEGLFGKQAESSWGATAGGAIGAMYGPLGAFIGSALGGMVDAAFGGDGKKRANAGFLASPTPGLKDEYNAGDHTFASGLKVTLFARRTDPSAARDIADVFGKVDESFVDLVKELGGEIDMRGKTLRGLDEEATPGSIGNLFGTGGNGTTQGDIAAQLASYLSQLADNVTGLDQALLDSVKSAGSAEEALTLLTQAVADKAAADKKEKESAETATKALNEKIRLQDEYDNLTMTSTQLLDKQRNALEESNRALFDQVQALKEAKRAEEERTAAFEMALDKARDFMSDLRSEQEQMIRDHYSELLDAERDLHNRRFNLFKSLMDATNSLRLGNLTTLNPRAQLEFAQSQFRSYASTALNTSLSMEDRVTAAEELRKAAEDYLAKGQGVYASSAAYKTIFNEVMQTLEASKFLGTNKEFDPTAIENAQLEELKKINQQLGILPPGIAAQLSTVMTTFVTAALAAGRSGAYVANTLIGQGPDAVKAGDPALKAATGKSAEELATTSAQAQAAVEQINAVSNSERDAVLAAVAAAQKEGLTVARLEELGVRGGDGASVSELLARYKIDAFADGGDHEGGWRLVGEQGPELEYTGPSHIFNARDTERMLKGGTDNAERRDAADKQDRIIKLLEQISRVLMVEAQHSGSQRSKTNQLLDEAVREMKSGSGVGSGRYGRNSK